MFKYNKYFLVLLAMSNNAFSNGDIESFSEWIHNGNVGGTAKSYYFEQDFDDSNAENSSIWVNGGNVTFNTSEFKGLNWEEKYRDHTLVTSMMMMIELRAV